MKLYVAWRNLFEDKHSALLNLFLTPTGIPTEGVSDDYHTKTIGTTAGHAIQVSGTQGSLHEHVW